MVRLLGNLLHNMSVLFNTGGIEWNICAHLQRAAYEFRFLSISSYNFITRFSRGPISDPRDDNRKSAAPDARPECSWEHGSPPAKFFCITPSITVARVCFAYKHAFQTAELCLRKPEQGPRIDISEIEGIGWQQILEDGGVAPVSRTQCDYCTWDPIIVEEFLGTLGRQGLNVLPYCLRLRLEVERGTLQETAELPELSWSQLYNSAACILVPALTVRFLSEQTQLSTLWVTCVSFPSSNRLSC